MCDVGSNYMGGGIGVKHFLRNGDLVKRRWGERVASQMKKLQRFDVTFCDIAENLESALEQFRGIYEDLEKD